MFKVIYNGQIKREYQLLNDNDIITIRSIKIKAISTPGHTIGSMPYLVNDSFLFVGDTFNLINNKIYLMGNHINMDREKQKASIKKLAYINNVSMAFTAHRGYTDEFYKAISYWK